MYELFQMIDINLVPVALDTSAREDTILEVRFNSFQMGLRLQEVVVQIKRLTE